MASKKPQGVVKAYKKLAELDSADLIAEFLKSESIKGHTGESQTCPIAQYLSKHTRSWTPDVGGEIHVEHRHTFETVVIDEQPPFAITDFIGRFDNGEYPDLEECCDACSEPF